MIRRYLELRRMGLGWHHWFAELLSQLPPSQYLFVCDLLGTAEWLWRRKRSRRVARELRRLLLLAGNPKQRLSPRLHFCAYWRLKFAHAYIALAPMEHVERLLEIKGQEHLSDLLCHDSGFVICSLHSVHGHLAAAYLVRRGKPTLTYRKAERATLVGTTVERMFFYGATPLFLRSDEPLGAVLKRSFDWLRQGNAAFVFVDGMYGQQQLTVEIFQRKVSLRPGLLEAARLARVPVTVAAVFTRDRKISIRFSAPQTVSTPSARAKVFRDLVNIYETVVLTSPESLRMGKFERRLLDRSS
ncbi:MAG: hypothetical protein ACP5UB_12400 [Candidatus Sumerlaeaceae bacterium]